MNTKKELLWSLWVHPSRTLTDPSGEPSSKLEIGHASPSHKAEDERPAEGLTGFGPYRTLRAQEVPLFFNNRAPKSSNFLR